MNSTHIYKYPRLINQTPQVAYSNQMRWLYSTSVEMCLAFHEVCKKAWQFVMVTVNLSSGSIFPFIMYALQWRHNGCDGVSYHQPHDYLLNRFIRHRCRRTSKLCVTGFCEGNSAVTGEFPTQRYNIAEKVSIWWRNRGLITQFGASVDHLIHWPLGNLNKILDN